ncbi:MAG: AAA family ATPase, partial [Acidobacteriota bacterium]
MSPLFQKNVQEYLASHAPLAERMRPERLADLVGQEDVVGPSGLLQSHLQAGRLPSLILWGPPGTGKTTLARILARRTGECFVQHSAVSCGVSEIKSILKEAEQTLMRDRKGTLLFLDEIHRFNKVQQDSLLHGVESGRLTLI